MNELVVKEQKIDIVEVVNVLTQIIEQFNEIEVNEENYLEVETTRKLQLTPFLDKYTSVLKESEEEYLRPYKNLVEPLKTTLDKMLELDKKLKADVLLEKKKAFKEEVRQEFYDLCNIMCSDGVLPDFEEIYNESWYGKTKKNWREMLLKKINDSIHKEETLTGYIVCELTRSQANDLKRFLTERQIQFSFEELKGE